MLCNFQHPPGAEARSFIASDRRQHVQLAVGLPGADIAKVPLMAARLPAATCDVKRMAA